MAPHQQRVVEEKAALDEKRAALAKFISGNVFSTLAQAERSDLVIQEEIMQEYSDILASRIARFS